MAKWATHSFCAKCWKETHPERAAVRLKDPPASTCCRCGGGHFSGTLRCEGKGAEHV